MESSRSAVGSADEVSSRSGGVTSPAKLARRSARRSGRRGDRPPGRRPLRKPATPEPNPELTVEDKVMHWWMEERSAYHPEWQRPEAWKWPEGRGGAPRAGAGAAAAGAATGLGSRVCSSRKSTMRAPAVPPPRKAAAAGAACRPAAKGQAKGAPTLVAPAAARPCGPFICYGLHNCYLLDADHTAARDGNYAARMAAQRKKAHAGPKPFIAGGALGGSGSALPGGACAAGGASGGLLACAAGGARRRLSQPAPRVRDGPAFAFELDADEEGVHALYRARVHSSPRAIAQINRRLRAQLVARAVPLGGTWSSSSALRVGELCRLRKIGEGIEEAAAGAAGSAHKAAACPVSKPIFSAVESSLLKEVQASLTVSKKSAAGTAKAFPAKAGAHVKNVTFKPPKSRSTSPHSPTPTSTSPKIQSARSPSPRPPKSPPFKFTAGQPSRPKSPPSRSLQSSSPPPRTQAPKRQPQKFPPPTSSSVTSPPSRSSPSRSPSRSSPSRSSPTRSSPTRSTPSPTAPSSPTPTSTLCGAPPDRTPPSRQSRTVFPKSPLSRSPTLSTTSSTTTSAVCVGTTDQSPNRHRTSVSPSSQGKAAAKRTGSPIQWSAANKRASSRRGPAAGGAPPGMGTPNVARCLFKTSSLRTSSSSLLPAEPSQLRRAAASGPYPYPYPLRPDAPARRPRVRSCLDAQTAALREARARLAGKLPKNRSAMTLPPKTAQAEAEGEAALEGEGEGDGEKGAPGVKHAWVSPARTGAGPASVEGAGSGAPKAAARAVRRRSESQLVHAARSETDKWLASRAGCRRQAAGLKVVDLLMPPEASATATAADDTASKGFPEASASSRVGASAGTEMRTAWSRSSFGALGPQPTGGRRQRGGPAVDALLPRPATERAVPHTEKSLRRHTVRAGRLAAPHPSATRSALFCFADAEPPREPLTPFLTDDSSPFGWQGGDDVAGKRSSEVQVDGVPDPYAYPDSPFEDEPYSGSRRVVGSILKRKSNDPISSSLKMYEEFSKLMEDTGHPSSCTSLIRASSAVGSQTLDDDSPRARDVQTSPPTSEGPRWKAVTSPRSLATLRDLSSGDVSWPTDSAPCTSKNAPSFAECEPKFCDQPSSADATKSSRKQNIAFDRILDMVMHEVEGSSNAKVRAKFRGIRQRKNGTPHWSTLLDETKAAEFSNLLTSRNEEYTVPPPQTLTRDDAASPPKTSPTPALSPTRAEGAALGSAPGSRTPGSRRPRTKSADVLRGPVDNAGLAQAPAEEAAGQRPAGVGGVTPGGPARRGPVADARADAPPMGPAACLGMALPLRGAASGPQVMQLSRPKEEHLPRRAAAGVMRGAPLGTSDDLRAPADARWKLCRPQMTPQQISRAPAKGPLRVDSRLRGRFPEGPPPPLAPPGARPPARRPPAAVEALEGVDELLAPAIPRARAITSSSLGKLASTLRRAERFS